MGDGDDNPFRLPPDDQIFLIREQERQKRLEERERQKHLHVWDKQTATSRVMLGKKIGDVVAEASADLRKASGKPMRKSQSDGSLKRQKENVADFVAKKREMFLVQMSLDVKNHEIKKLVEKASLKDEALKKSQQMLDEDVSRFDTFLQNNDQKAHKAMKDAEEETKKKQDRLQRIKHLKSQLSAVQSEIAKHREQKEECMKYKAFLDKLTPQDFKDQKAQEKVQRKIDRRKRFVDGEMAMINTAMEAEFAQEERFLEDRAAETAKARRRNRREQEEAAREQEKELVRRKEKIRRKYPLADAVEADYEEVSSGAEMPLYFTNTPQLLEIFTSLEEQNLFLIQSSQDKEMNLEEIVQKLAAKKKVMGSQIAKLQMAVSELEDGIRDEQALAESLKQQAQTKVGGTERDGLISDLTNKIINVHSECGHDTEHDPDPKVMLKGIEFSLEDFLRFLDEEEAYDRAKVDHMFYTKERVRRLYVKVTRKEDMDKNIQERLEKSLFRSQLPIHKKVGKQLMFKSPPLLQDRRIVVEDEGREEAIRDHDLFGLFINRNDGLPYTEVPKDPLDIF